MNEFTMDEFTSARDYKPGVPAYKTPITPKENWKRAFRREKTCWVPMYSDVQSFIPQVIPDSIARGMVYEALPLKQGDMGGKDEFGINWVYVPVVGGSMEDPNQPPVLEDVNDWKSCIHFPDVDSWDWAGCSKRNEGYIDHDRYVVSWIFTGMFERLISFMGFENAAMALVDEDQETALHDLFDAIADTHIQVITHLHNWFHIDGIYFHDDWGAQKAPFFSLETCREMIVPHIKKIVDHCHALGLTFEFHCCGKSEALAPAMIEMGADAWSGQVMNDKYALREKYGDKMLIGIQFFPENEDEMKQSIDHLLKQTQTDYIQKPMYVQNIKPDENMRRYLYMQSRKMFGGK